MSSHEVNEQTPSLVGTSVRGVDDTEEHFTDIAEAKKQSLVTAPSGRKQSDQSDKDYSTLVDLAEEGALMCEEEKYAALLDDSGKLKPNAYVNLDTEAIKQQDGGASKAVAEDDLVEDEGSDKAGDAAEPPAEPPAGEFKTPSSSSLEKSFDIITQDDVADNKASSIYSLKNEGQSNMSLEELIDSQMASFTELSSTLQTKISKKSSPSRKSKSKSKKKQSRRDSTSGLIPESVIENDSLQTVPAGAAEGACSPFVHPRSTSAVRSSAGGATTNSSQSAYFDNTERPHLARGESYNGSASELRPGRSLTRDDPLKSLRSESREYLSSISRSRTRAPEPIVSNSELIEEGALINDSQYDQELDEARDNVIDHADEIVNAEPVTGPVTEMGRIEEESKAEDGSLAKAGELSKPSKDGPEQVSNPVETEEETEEETGAKTVGKAQEAEAGKADKQAEELSPAEEPADVEPVVQTGEAETETTEPAETEPAETEPAETEPTEQTEETEPEETNPAGNSEEEQEVKPLEKSSSKPVEKDETKVDSISTDLKDLRIASPASPSDSKTTISEAERLIKELEDAMDDDGAEAEAETGDQADQSGTEPENKAEPKAEQEPAEAKQEAKEEAKQEANQEANQEAKQEAEDELHEPSREEIIELLKDEPVYIYTSLAGGGFMMPSRTNMLETILRANRVPFTFRDLGTDEEARNVWKRYGRGRQLPGVVRGKDDIIGNWEEIQEANESYQVRHLIYETL